MLDFILSFLLDCLFAAGIVIAAMAFLSYNGVF
jgi:uncharacterized membrane protein YqgA involved in biofilm formation